MVFDVVTAPVLTLYRDLEERRIELVITRLVEFADRENMSVEKLFEDSIVAVAAAENPWTRRRRIELAELADEPWTLPPSDTGIGAFAADAFRARGLKPPQASVITYSMHMCHKLLATGRFLSMLSRLHLDAARQASLAQGIACRVGQCARNDCDHYVEESYAQPARGVVHRDGPHRHAVAGEGKIAAVVSSSTLAQPGGRYVVRGGTMIRKPRCAA